MASKSGLTKEEEKVLSLLRLGRNYVIDVIAAGKINAEARLADAVGNEVHAGELRRVQAELHYRIESAEVELVKEIAKNVQ